MMFVFPLGVGTGHLLSCWPGTFIENIVKGITNRIFCYIEMSYPGFSGPTFLKQGFVKT